MSSSRTASLRLRKRCSRGVVVQHPLGTPIDGRRVAIVLPCWDVVDPGVLQGQDRTLQDSAIRLVSNVIPDDRYVLNCGCVSEAVGQAIVVAARALCCAVPTVDSHWKDSEEHPKG